MVLVRRELNFCLAMNFLKKFFSNEKIAMDLTDFVHQDLNFEKGHFFTILDSTAEKYVKYNFDSGLRDCKGIYSEHIGPHFQEMMQSGVYALSLADDPCVTQADLKKYHPEELALNNLHTYKGRLIYSLDQPATLEEVRLFLDKGAALWYSFAAISIDIFPWPKLEKNLTERFLRDFVSKIVAFYVRAYDGDSYIVWERERHSKN